MEKEEKKKNGMKVLVPAIIAVVTLVTLTFGATYAYFTVSATATGYTTRTAKATAASVGSVALTHNDNLVMNLTAAQMMKPTSDKTYYAGPNATSESEVSPTIATAKVTGAGTFTCNYTLSVTATGTNNMYTKFQGMAKKSVGQIVLTINNGGTTTTMDFNDKDLFPKTISGTMTGLTSAAPKTITAQLKLVNSKDIDQTALAGTDITVSFAVSGFTCVATA